MIDRVGQRFGDYRLIRFLGRGGFGEVYLGEHAPNKTLAAVKVLKTDLKDVIDPKKFAKNLKEFINEASAFNLKHPHIVQLLAFGIGKDDTPFLVFDYAPNGSLRSRHPRGTRLPLTTIVTYVKQIAAALQYAHDQRRIHRDVKPENILLGSTNEILLSDFGIAVVAHSTLTQTPENAIGTARYMAPEQWRGEPLTATDQYALGITVYEWLCGECPFDGDILQLQYQHTQLPPPPLREKVSTIPPEVEQVVMTALAKDPNRRFKSVQAFANALEQAYKVKPAIGSTLLTYRGHSGGAYTLAWSSDSRRIVSSLLETVQVWDANTGTTLLTHREGFRQVYAVAWSPDGRYIALGNSFNEVEVRDATTGSSIYTHSHPNSVHVVAWSPDGRRIATGVYDGTVRVWDATTGSNVITYRGRHSDSGGPREVNAVAWSPDGKRVISGFWDKTVQVWDATTGSHVVTYSGHSGRVIAAVCSPDGKCIASSSAGDTTVQVWDASTGTKLLSYSGHSDRVNALAWSPDGRYIASGSADGMVRVWDASAGGNVYTYRGHADGVRAVAWSPDGKRIVSCSSDTVQVWDAPTGGNVLTYRGHSHQVNAVAWSPDGKRIVSGSWNSAVRVWDASNGAIFLTYRGHTGGIRAVAWSPDGTYIASASHERETQVWDASTGTHILTCDSFSREVNAVAWSPDGMYIAITTLPGVKVWSVKTKKCVITYKCTWPVRVVVWSPDGRSIAFGDDSGNLEMCNVDLTRDFVSFPQAGAIIADPTDWGGIAWSPDSSRIAYCNEYGSLCIKDMVTGKFLLEDRGYYGPVAWSPDGKCIAIGASIISPATGGTIYTYRGHSGYVNAVAWSPDGTRIASASDDGTVHIWQAV